jgi:protein-disulfide isomerase
LIVAGFIYLLWTMTAGGPATIPATQVPDPSLGPADAPVVITQYSDFGCPSCRGWHSAGIRDQILAAYPDQVRFVWKDLPMVTPLSPKAAEAGHCASAQGQFWAYHDYLYEEGTLRGDGLTEAAVAVGLDQAEFARCLESGEMAGKVSVNEQEARRHGLRGTPGFVINDRPLPAPPNFAQLASIIEGMLP